MAAPSSSSPHLPFLDGLRGFAALYVVLHHAWLGAYAQRTDLADCVLCRDAPAWTSVFLWGQLAVAVFMVVSGFSLAISPLHHGDRLSHGFTHYIYRRGFRIIPPYWAALAISCLVIVFLTGDATGNIVNTKAVIAHGLLVQNIVDSPKPNGAFWSIAVEWQIYFVFPLLLWAWRRFDGTVTIAATLMLVLTAYALGTQHAALATLLGLEPQQLAPLSKLLYLRPHFFALFAFGVAAAHVLAAGGRFRSWTWTSIGGLALGAAVVYLALLPNHQIEGNFFWIDLIVGASVAALLAGLAQRPSSWLSMMLGGRIPGWLGQSSYSLYLIHVPVLEIVYHLLVQPRVQDPNARFLALTLIAVPLSMLASRLFWRVFELPFVKHRSLRELNAAFSASPVRLFFARLSTGGK